MLISGLHPLHVRLCYTIVHMLPPLPGRPPIPVLPTLHVGPSLPVLTKLSELHVLPALPMLPPLTSLPALPTLPVLPALTGWRWRCTQSKSTKSPYKLPSKTILESDLHTCEKLNSVKQISKCQRKILSGLSLADRRNTQSALCCISLFIYGMGLLYGRPGLNGPGQGEGVGLSIKVKINK